MARFKRWIKCPHGFLKSNICTIATKSVMKPRTNIFVIKIKWLYIKIIINIMNWFINK
jgi:hypothetical protein